MSHHHCSERRGIPKGTSELYGHDMLLQTEVIKRIRNVYQRMGFDELRTPTLEFAETFDGYHGEGEDLLFHLKDKQLHNLVLRYDLTVPLARFIGDHPELPIPFKRYQIEKVFRDDKPDKGHYREFIQCDGDIVGVDSLSADADIVNVAYQGFKAINIPNGKIRLNHRLILKGITEKLNLGKESTIKIQRTLDHIDKLKGSSLLEEINKQDLPQRVEPLLKKLIYLKGTTIDKLNQIESLLSGTSAEGGILELRQILSLLDIDTQKVTEIDVSLARGADYYTGFILEGVIENSGIGAVLGGGRYDKLISDLGGPNLPAVGMAFGLERLFLLCKDYNLLAEDFETRTIIICNNKRDEGDLLRYAQLFRIENFCDFISLPGIPRNAAINYAKSRGFTTLFYGTQKEEIDL